MIPLPDYYRHMFDFLTWGDRVMLAAARTVPEDGYFREQPISLGSVHKLLTHAIAVERIWLSRCQGRDARRFEDETDHPTLADLERNWPPLHGEWLAFLSVQTPESLAADLAYRNSRGEPYRLPLGHVLLHVLDHATYHRGQLNSMIKLAGGKPTAVGYANYIIEKTKQA